LQVLNTLREVIREDSPTAAAAAGGGGGGGGSGAKPQPAAPQDAGANVLPNLAVLTATAKHVSLDPLILSSSAAAAQPAGGGGGEGGDGGDGGGDGGGVAVECVLTASEQSQLRALLSSYYDAVCRGLQVRVCNTTTTARLPDHASLCLSL